MIVRNFFAFAMSVFIATMATTVSSRAQTPLPLEGPGLGNLTYTDAELFREVSIIKANTADGTYKNGFPAYRFGGSKLFGTNVGIMLNGYFLTSFAPDSGQSPGGFLLYDVSDPRNIKLVKTVYDPTGTTSEFREPHAYGITTINGKDYVAIPSKFGVEFWDFTDINDIKQVKKLALPGVNGGDYEDVTWQLWWQAPYLYVASASRGLFIVDARDPENPKLADRGPGFRNPLTIGRMGGFRIGPVFAMGNQLLVSGMETAAGFSTLDISNPLHPVLLSTRNSLPFYYATCYNGKTIYSSGRNDNGTMVGINVSDPRNFVVENENTPMRQGLYCATQDNFLISGNQDDIVKLDVSNPATYVEVGRSERVGRTQVPEPNNPHSMDPDLGQVAMFGNLVFIGSDHGVNTAFRPHQKAADTTPPAVIAQSPANAALHQASTTRVGFGLSDSILPESINAQTFIVKRKNGEAVTGTYSVWLGMINFSPAQPLEKDTEYEVTLTAGGIKDFAGNGLAQEFKSTFKTAVQDPVPVPEFVYSHSYVNRWPLADSLLDVAGGNNGVTDTTVRFTDGALDTTLRTRGVELTTDKVAETLGESATVSFRIKTSQTGNNSMWQAPGILGRDHIGGSNDIFWGWIDAGGFLNLQTGDDTGRKTRSSVRINDGQWHEVAMTRNAETGDLAMYVDGIKTSSRSVTGSLGFGNKIHMIGQIDDAPAFKGFLSDLRVYSRTLSDFEARAIFQPDLAVLPQQQTGQVVTIDPARLGLSGVRYVWNFGDGSPPITTTSDSPIVSYTYAKPGNYTVTVTVVDANGTERPYAFNQSVINTVTAVAPVHTSNIVGNASFVYTLDPDAGTVAQIDARTQAKLWEVKVGAEPKTLALDQSGRVWVAVQGEDRLVRIDPVTKALTSFPFAYGSAPYGVAFTPDGRQGLVTLAGTAKLVVFSPTNGALIGAPVALPSGDLRGIAISGNSTTAYITRFRSKMTQGEVYKVDLVRRTASTIALKVDVETNQSEAAAPGVPNYVNQVVISPDGLRAILPSKKDNIVDGRFRTQIDLKSDSTVRSILSNVDLQTGQEVFAEQIDFNNRAPARAAIFAPAGNYMFVAQMESNSVEIIDTYRRVVIGVIKETGRTPHGLYIDAATKKLYINNFLDRSVTVHDISQILSGVDFITLPPTVVKTVATEPLAANILAGKRVFYNAADPRMSNEAYISCASCHVDGDSDDMIWDFTQRGEGLRRTISLQGKRGAGQFDVETYKQPLTIDRTSLASLAGGTNSLAERVGLVQGRGLTTTQATAKLGQLARVVAQLKEHVASITPPGQPNQVAFLADEFDSLQGQFISLLKTSTLSPATSKLHWTGNFDEVQDFEKDIRVEFEGSGFLSDADYQSTIDPLGAKKAGLSAELDNLTAFVTSLNTFHRSPFRDERGCLTSEAQKGEKVFQKENCAACHGNSVSQDNKRHDVGTIQASSGKGSDLPLEDVGFDTPNIYGLWQSSTFFHNGQAKSLEEVFQRRQVTPQPGETIVNVSPEHGGRVPPGHVSRLVAYLQSLDGSPVCRSGASQ